MPKVSIIIPVHNREGFIRNAIRSVLNQTFLDYELIVVDDGSTDKTADIVNNVRHHKIKYIHQNHRERSIARNNGIKNSNGEYIAFLDSDDVWLPEKLKVQVKTMDENKEVGLTYTDSYLEDINGENIQQHSKKYLCPSGDVFCYLYIWNFCRISTVMTKRSVINDVGIFNEKYIGVEDYELWFRISSKYNIQFIDKVLARYCYHMWSNLDYKIYMLKENIKLLKRICSEFPDRRNELEPLRGIRIKSLLDELRKCESKKVV